MKKKDTNFNNMNNILFKPVYSNIIFISGHSKYHWEVYTFTLFFHSKTSQYVVYSAQYCLSDAVSSVHGYLGPTPTRQTWRQGNTVL